MGGKTSGGKLTHQPSLNFQPTSFSIANKPEAQSFKLTSYGAQLESLLPIHYYTAPHPRYLEIY